MKTRKMTLKAALFISSPLLCAISIIAWVVIASLSPTASAVLAVISIILIIASGILLMEYYSVVNHAISIEKKSELARLEKAFLTREELPDGMTPLDLEKQMKKLLKIKGRHMDNEQLNTWKVIGRCVAPDNELKIKLKKKFFTFDFEDICGDATVFAF